MDESPIVSRIGLLDLPLEVLEHIITLSASGDPTTAHALAYVSKRICRMSALERWRTVVFRRSPVKFHRFCKMLIRVCSDASRPPSVQSDHTDSESDTESEGTHEAKAPPPASTQKETKDAIVDEDRDFWQLCRTPHRLLSIPQWRHSRIHYLFHLVENVYVDCDEAEERDIKIVEAGSDIEEDYKGETQRPLRDQTAHMEQLRVAFEHLMYCPNLRCLALGNTMTGALALYPVYRLVYRDLADFVNTGDKTSKEFADWAEQGRSDCWHLGIGTRVKQIEHLMLTYSAPAAEGPRDTDNSLDGVLLRIHSLLPRTRRLHVVALDRDSPDAGVPIPFAAFEKVMSGAITSETAKEVSALAWIRERTAARKRRGDPPPEANWGPRGWLPNPSVTQIRYDTRRFAFRPPEITAIRLRPFFSELVLDDVPSTPGNNAHGFGDASSSSSANFSHEGKRHAAPSYGAGNAEAMRSRAQQPISMLSEGSEEARLLSSLGVGGFKTIHLAWDVSPDIRKKEKERAQQKAMLEARTRAQHRRVSQRGLASKMAAEERQVMADGLLDSTLGLVRGSASYRPMLEGADDTEQDWPLERRDVWTNRSTSAADDGPSGSTSMVSQQLTRELIDAVKQLYGWHPEAARRFNSSSSSNMTTQSAGMTSPLSAGSLSGWTPRYAPHNAGELGERIAKGFSPSHVETLRVLPGVVSGHLDRRQRLVKMDREREEAKEHPANEVDQAPASNETTAERGQGERPRPPPLSPPPTPSGRAERPLRYAVRAPSTMLKLGGYGAFTSDERLELFLDWVAGGPGSWAAV